MKDIYGFDVGYIGRVVLVILAFGLNNYLGLKYGFRIGLLVMGIFSLLATLILWTFDGILELDFKPKYTLYYAALTILPTLISPEYASIIRVMFDTGFREEMFYRFFMVGIFKKYYLIEEKRNNKKILCRNIYIKFIFYVKPSIRP